LADHLALYTHLSADLALIIERWEALPEPVRAGIVAMVRATIPRARNAETRKPSTPERKDDDQ
jgi:hypothetical protein